VGGPGARRAEAVERDLVHADVNYFLVIGVRDRDDSRLIIMVRGFALP